MAAVSRGPHFARGVARARLAPRDPLQHRPRLHRRVDRGHRRSLRSGDRRLRDPVVQAGAAALGRVLRAHRRRSPASCARRREPVPRHRSGGRLAAARRLDQPARRAIHAAARRRAAGPHAAGRHARGARVTTTTVDAAGAPIAATERVDVLDVLRGIAVLGILLVNIESLIGYGFVASTSPPAGARFDERSLFLVEFLVQGKFYCLFSFLFGVGFAVFVRRAAARGRDAVALFKRRLVGLLLIGCVHSFLIWYGDILITYAVIGFGLIPFLRRDDRTLLRAAAIWLASPVAFYLVLMLLARLGPAEQPSGGDDLPPNLANAVESFAHGSYPAVVKGNLVFTAANVVRRLVLMFFPRV